MVICVGAVGVVVGTAVVRDMGLNVGLVECSAVGTVVVGMYVGILRLVGLGVEWRCLC